MPLKLNKPPGATTRNIILPSEGFPYPELKGGQLLVRAFDYDTESIMYGSSDSTSTKQYAKLCTLLGRLVDLPKDLKPGKLLEGDSAYIVMTARSLSYPEQRYTFSTTCEHCNEVENHSLQIPEQLPQNRYPSDFVGYLSLTTFNNNILQIRFLTLEDDLECNRLAKERVTKKVITEDLLDSDYLLNRLAFSLLRANGERPAHMEEARDFFRAMPFDEREEIQRAIRKHAPGFNSQLVIICPNCNQKYEMYVPMNMDFFRVGSRAVRTELPGGVRIGVSGPDDMRIPAHGAPTPNDDRAPDSGPAGGARSGDARPPIPPKKVAPPGALQQAPAPVAVPRPAVQSS